MFAQKYSIVWVLGATAIAAIVIAVATIQYISEIQDIYAKQEATASDTLARLQKAREARQQKLNAENQNTQRDKSIPSKR